MHNVRLISCVGVEHDLPLLPFFLEHYLELGVAPSHMHIVLNASREGTEEMTRARSILETHGVEPEERWIEPYTSGAMWEKRREVQRRVADATDWVVSADVDEFQEFPTELSTFLEYCERREIDCVQGVFIDRVAPEGRLAAVAPTPSIWEQFPIETDVICTIRSAEDGSYWYGTVNIMVCRGDVLPARGGHDPLDERPGISHLFGRELAKFPWITNSAFRFAIPLRVHHFKWTDALVTSLRERLSTSGVSKAGKAYGELLLEYFDENDGIALEGVPIKRDGGADSVPWRARVSALRASTHIFSLVQSIRGRAAQYLRSAKKKAARWTP